MPTALITGASRGLGAALADALADRGWTLLLDARGADDLFEVADHLHQRTRVGVVPGDVTDPDHRTRLAEAAAEAAPIDLLVNNASTLGPSPMPALVDLRPDDLGDVLQVNVVAPLALVQTLRPYLAADATIVNVTSDASVEAYEGWGAYATSKAALDHLTAILGAERPEWHVYAVDPGDMRTAMHQAAFPGEDISDRPLPELVVPSLLRLLDARPASGRLRAADWAVEEVSA